MTEPNVNIYECRHCDQQFACHVNGKPKRCPYCGWQSFFHKAEGEMKILVIKAAAEKVAS